MTKFFKKIIKKTISRPFWAAFAQNLGKNEISWEKRLSVFGYSSYLPLCQKSGKTNEPLLRNMLNWRTDRKTDR